MIRIAMLGFWHVHAKDYAAEAQAHPDAQLVAAWDEDPERGAEGAANLGIPFHADLDELLARDDVDGVIVTTRTTAHLEVMLAAAGAGKHIFTEKVVALTPADAQRIVDAAEGAGVILTVSLPRLSHGYTLAIREILASGRLGTVTQVRVPAGARRRDRPEWLPARFFDADDAGGGALVDLGCHPLYLTRLFLGGMPESVSAEYGRVTGRAVDDNAVALLRHRSGALGIAESGLRQPGIAVHDRDPRHVRQPAVRNARAEADGPSRVGAGRGRVERGPGPPRRPTPFEQWLGSYRRRHARDREHRPRARSHRTRRCR